MNKPTNNTRKTTLLEVILHGITLILSAVILIGISYDTLIYNDPFYPNTRFAHLQSAVCLFFLADLIFNFSICREKKRFFPIYAISFLVCVPWAPILDFLNVSVAPNIRYFMRFLPLLRCSYALTVVIGWITAGAVSKVFYTYLFTLATGVYLCSLAFYVSESGINPQVTHYTDALFWACMDAVTVGCNIEPVSPVGKILAVFDAALGIMMFPLFTVYVTDSLMRIRSIEKHWMRS